MKKGTIHKLLDYFFQNHQDEMILAMREFFDNKNISHGRNLTIQNDQEEGLFMEWIVFDYRLQNGRKLIQDYLLKNQDNLSKKELSVYEDLQMNKYGMYEILDIKRDEYIEMESLQSGKKYKVSEKAGTYNARIKTTCFCRIGKVGNHWELVGSNPIGFPVYHTERAKKLMRKVKGEYSPKDTRKLLIAKNNKPSEFEMNLKIKEEEFNKKQDKIRVLLEKQLIKSKSTSSVSDILKIVYKSKGNDDLTKIVSLLIGTNDKPTQKILDLTSSVWNYFPHKSLSDKSPAEKAKEIYGER